MASNEISTTWSFIKSLVSNQNTCIHFIETDSYYDIRTQNGQLVYETRLHKLGYEPEGLDINQNETDLLDFETYYKLDGNPLEKISVINDITTPINIVQVPPVIPYSGTEVNQVGYGSISIDSDTTYVIPDGETLVIQTLVAGAESQGQGSAVELWYDPNGNGIGMEIIDVIYVNGTSDQHTLRPQYEGDGTKAIRMRRKVYGGGSRTIFGRWEGYY